MRVVTSVAGMQRLALGWRGTATRVGFVPTMGSLHAGHLSLVHRARREVGAAGKVVVSLFVNPTQFGPREDLASYPRDPDRDRLLCREAGVDVLFMPSAEAMYSGDGERGHSTYVVEERLAGAMEGVTRPTHFRGVTTVVAKLFNIVLPEVAVFGAKDWQQGAVVGRMVRDLNFPVRLVVAPTVREEDGLAISSRNRYLSAEERGQGTVLWAMLGLARARVKGSKAGVAAGALRRELLKEVARRPAARLDYVAFFDAETLAPVRRVREGTHMALAVYVGRTRLIDNGQL